MAKTKKPDYASMFTLRADGRYQGYWHELDRDGKPTGPRHYIYDRDPEKLFDKIREKETPQRRTVKAAAEAWEQLRRDSVKDRTWANYKPHLDDIVARYGDLPLEDLSAADIQQDLLAGKAKDWSHTVVNTRRVIWHGICEHAIGERWLLYDPSAGVKLPGGLKKGRRSAPEEEVITRILADAGDLDFGFVVFFLLCTGVRRGEALQRLKSDVDTKEWVLRIPQAKTAAGVRSVPLIEPLREPLKAWMDAHPGPWLFPHRDYYAGRKGAAGHMSDSNWETAWKKYCEDRGWTDEDGKPVIGAHNLRHGTATLLYESEVDLYTAKAILGHANIQTTLEIYTDLREEHEKKNVGKFSSKMSEKMSKKKKDA